MTTQVKGLYLGNYKTVHKDTEEGINTWKPLLGSWIGGIKIDTISILPRAISRFKTILSEQMAFFTELEQVILNFICNHKRPQIATAASRKKNKTGGVRPPDIKLHYKAIGFKTAWSWHKTRHIDQWNIVKRLEINPGSSSHVKYDTASRNIERGKEMLVNEWLPENWTAAHQKMNLGHLLPPCPRRKSRWIKDLNVGLETIKILEDNVRSKLSDMSLCNSCSDISLQAWERKEKTNEVH